MNSDKVTKNLKKAIYGAIKDQWSEESLNKAFKMESKGLEDAINQLSKLSQRSDIMASELEAIDETIQHIKRRYRLVLDMQKLLKFSEN